MLEEGELLEHGGLTGFRLCSKEGWTFPNGKLNEWNRTFSAFTDPNDANRVFICSQNGQLRVLDGSNKSSKDYHILFRRFANTEHGDKDMGLPVSSHWDKLSLLPGRPGELLFVLGISKAIMYTAVPGFTGPYPKSPLLAKTTRGDLPDFAYGTPVLELTSHDSRVTAMAVSPSSSILVSGDEHGFVKVLLLASESADAAAGGTELHEWKKQQNSSFNEADRRHENIRLTIRAHNGPVFSLQWLPVAAVVKRALGPAIRGLGALANNESELVYSNCLASGSSVSPATISLNLLLFLNSISYLL
jgi:WD40 repeat protein